MNVIKNIEISRKYGVSPTTVANWIESAKKHKNNLQLIEIKDKTFILDTANNRLLMEKMTNDGRKHKSSDARKILTPLPKFYEIFNEEQISELILGIENHNEILHKYTYLNVGAKDWQNYSIRTFKENIANTISNTQTLLNNSTNIILGTLDIDQKFNVIDIGPGDLAPVIDLLDLMIKNLSINKYVGIDFSSEMLDITQSEFLKRYQNKIPYEQLVGDATKDFFQHKLLKLSKDSNSQSKLKNLIMFVGSTIENEPSTFKTLLNIVSSLNKEDIILIGYTLNSTSGKSYFDLKDDNDDKKESILNEKNKWIPDLLQITSDLYNVEQYYSEEETSRKMDLILNSDLEIEFNYDKLSTQLKFRKGDRITVWRHKHHSLAEIVRDFDKAGLEIMHTTTSKDMAQILIMARIKNS